MSEKSNDSNLPEIRRETKLEELDPHERRIERMAEIYFGACERAARLIGTIKNRLGGSTEDR